MTTPAILSLSQLMDPDVLADPYPLYHSLRANEPVYWDPYLHAWVVTRYQDVVSVLVRFSANRTPTPEYFEALGVPELSPVARMMVKQMLFMDAPDHTRLRRLAGPAFQPAKVDLLREQVQDVADQLIARIRSRATPVMDLLADFAEPFPAIVTAKMLGVPTEDHGKLKDWSVTFAEMLGNFQHNPDRLGGVLEVLENLSDYFANALREHRSEPRDGVLQSLMSAEADGDRLSDEEIIANCIVTMVGGLETTTNLIGNGILTLLRHPAHMARIREEPAITKSAVEEILRFESPSQHTARLAPADVELGGKQIARKQAVIAVMAAGNRDPERFPDPDVLDFDRRDNRHLAFGWAAHFCFGAPLARLEGRIAFDSLLSAFPDLRLVDQPLTFRENLGLRGLRDLPLSFGAVS